MPSPELLKMRSDLAALVAKLHELIGAAATLEVLTVETKLIQLETNGKKTK